MQRLHSLAMVCLVMASAATMWAAVPSPIPNSLSPNGKYELACLPNTDEEDTLAIVRHSDHKVIASIDTVQTVQNSYPHITTTWKQDSSVVAVIFERRKFADISIYAIRHGTFQKLGDISPDLEAVLPACKALKQPWADFYHRDGFGLLPAGFSRGGDFTCVFSASVQRRADSVDLTVSARLIFHPGARPDIEVLADSFKVVQEGS